MAKEFDIYLRDRLTQCDIIVYSIPFRDGLTVTNRLILESCLESYVLQKFIAVQTGSELVSHIDKMIKTCYERLNLGVSLGANAEFKKLSTIYPNQTEIELYVDSIDSAATVFAAAESQLIFGVNNILAFTGKSLGRNQIVIEPSVTIRNALKTSIEKASFGAVFNADSLDMHKQAAEQIKNGVEIVSSLTDLCYQVYRAASIGINICAKVVETEIHFSLGAGNSAIELLSAVTGEHLNKYEVVFGTVSILAELVESITQFMIPTEVSMALLAEAASIIRRYRLLNEMDENDLSYYDDMTLEDVDYVILGF